LSDNEVEFAYTYHPYGTAEITEPGTGVGTSFTPFLFTGGLSDRSTGWTSNGARYDDATEGRWNQMGTLDSPLDPANANRYVYAANNPVNLTDPLGTELSFREACTIGGTSAAFGEGIAGAIVGTFAGGVGIGPGATAGIVSGVSVVASPEWLRRS
jgi:RHS repeat-associated protein